MSDTVDRFELRETLVRACIEGPESLQRLVHEQGLVLATEFNGIETKSVLYEVLFALVIHDAPLGVLDVLERQWPRLIFKDQRNALTELITLESNLRHGYGPIATIVGYPARIEPDDVLRASFRTVTQDLIRRMETFEDKKEYRIDGCGFLNGTGTIQQTALRCEAYYVYEALPCRSLKQFADCYLFTDYSRWCVRSTEVRPVALDVIVHLAASASYDQLIYVRERLLLGYQQIWDDSVKYFTDETYVRVGIIQVNVHLTTQELRKWRRLAFLGMYQPIFDPQTRTRRMRWNFPREVFDLVADMLCDF